MPKKATTRKKIATVQLTESELILIGEILASLEYNEDARAQSALYVMLRDKIRTAKAEFLKYT